VGSAKPPVTIKPGDSSDIKVTIKTAGKSGAMTKTITVVTNDPREPNRAMNLTSTVVLPAGAMSHPEFKGAQEILRGQCMSCHVTPGIGKKGAVLYEAACAMCHGDQGEGKTAAALNQPGMAQRDDKAVFEIIAKGIQARGMPGFLKGEVESGPYDKAQLESLVTFIKGWQRKPAGAAPKS